MKLQYTTNCALLMMAYVASENRIVPSRELETAILFPQQNIFTAGRKLKKNGLMNTVNGPFGGYVLAKPPEDITVHEILTAVNDTFTISEGMSGDKYAAPALSNLTKMLSEAKDALDQKMDSFTLADLLKKGKE